MPVPRNHVDGVATSGVASEPREVVIYGATEHNLQALDLCFPRNQLVVITGLSGSGKSSLAFDTLYAEGQYRYAQTFSAYARSFIGELRRPSVDRIEGLSPVIAIEQGSKRGNPRSTVGTHTEVYDFLRVLYARIGCAHSATGKQLQQMGKQEIVDRIAATYAKESVSILAPLVRARKGHYRELFAQLFKQGYARVYVDGALLPLRGKMQLDRFMTHDIAVVVDHLQVEAGKAHGRLQEAVETALGVGRGVLMLLRDGADQEMVYYSTMLSDPDTGLAIDVPEPNTFSFNTPRGACPRCKGLGRTRALRMDTLIPDEQLSVAQGGLAALGPMGQTKGAVWRGMGYLLEKYGASLKTPIKELSAEALNGLLYGDDGMKEEAKVSGGETLTDLVQQRGAMGWVLRMELYGVRGYEKYLRETLCTSCKGQRLRPESLRFLVAGLNIAELSTYSLDKLLAWVKRLPKQLNKREQQIAGELLTEIINRIRLLIDLGLEYLELNRPIVSLSGGETQRTRLATQLGNRLVGVMYVLDEPSIGLHARDNDRLIRALEQLRDLGNSVLVVEHDRDMMLAADHIIDLGPGAGVAGGQVVAQGTPKALQAADTLTGAYLSGARKIERALSGFRKPDKARWLKLLGAKGNNLKTAEVRIPLGLLCCLTGVSGSGKSSLVSHTLVPILKQHFYNSKHEPLSYDALEGLEALDKIVEIDQRPIGRTPRSNPATYTGVFTDIRNWYAQLPESQLRGYGAGRFSFNVSGGRCEACKGYGVEIIEMDFLPEVSVPCANCGGRRYNLETLEIRYRGCSIADVLEMPVADAVSFFEAQPRIAHKIATLHSVGMGYLRLGQHATTLSGGEAQRMKLSAELLRADSGRTFYVLDEPTTGLHFEDIVHLMKVLNQLVSRGNSVLVIEHNLEVVAAADYVIDLGPEGGAGGGQLVDCGTPCEVAKRAKGPTGKALARLHTTSLQTPPSTKPAQRKKNTKTAFKKTGK